MEDPTFGYIWIDISNPSEKIPTFRDVVMAKILKTDDLSVVKRKALLKKKKINPPALPSLARPPAAESVPKVPTPEPRSPTRTSESPAVAPARPTAFTDDSDDIMTFESHVSGKSSTPRTAPMAGGSHDIDEVGPVAPAKLNREELRMNREQVIEDKVKEALEFKRELDDKAAKEAQEVDAAKEKHDKKLLAWSTNNKEKRNIRTLLSTMHVSAPAVAAAAPADISVQTVLWPGSSWKAISLGDLIEAKQVRLQYRKAMLVVHPDRCSSMDSETKFIAKRIFEAVNEAFEEFQKKEGV